jgi:SnoaL-like domain
MNPIEVSQRAIDAWNRHDADAYVALYAEGGTYHAPRMDNPLTGKAIAYSRVNTQAGALSLVSPGSLRELHERGGGAGDIRRRGS